MLVSVLNPEIASHSFRPKGIKVSFELWKDLVTAGRIKWRRSYLEGIIDSEIDFPVLNDTIFVHVAPEFDKFSFKLPKIS